MRRILAVAALAALLYAAAAWAVSPKLAVTLDAGGAPKYRSGEIYNGTIAAAARDSTRLVDVRGFNRIWVAIYTQGSTAAAKSQPVTIAFQATDFACIDSAGVAEYLKGYAGGDSAQSPRATLAAMDVVGATLDTLCREPWMPAGIRQASGATVPKARADTTYIGVPDTTQAAATKVQQTELAVTMPPRRANQGTTSQTFLQPAVYKFPLADLNGIWFEARYLQLRFRNLSEGSVTIRARIYLYKD